MQTISIQINPHHLFRYPSEWDPRDDGKTKGGYLEGFIQLPEDSDDLRVVLSTHPALSDDADCVYKKYPEYSNVHPTILHLIRKKEGGTRLREKEPVSNIKQWQMELLIKEGLVFVRNITSEKDEPRYEEGKIDRIAEEDFLFKLRDDKKIILGKKTDELNIVIHIPKTEARSNDEEINLKNLLETRITEQTALKNIMDNYKGKKSSNIKKMMVKVDLYSLHSNDHIGSGLSTQIVDKGSKDVGAMDIKYAGPLVSCEKGGRKIVVISEYKISKDVDAVFQIYDAEGNRLKNQEHLITQPKEVVKR